MGDMPETEAEAPVQHLRSKRRGGDRARFDLMIGADADPALRLPG